MGTEVLRPQDCLIERIRVSPCRRRNYYYGNGNGNFANPNVYSSNNHSNPRSNRKPSAVRSDRSDQRKKQSESLISKKSRSVDDIVKTYKNNSSSTNKVVEKVTILRRGESLDSKIKSSSETAAATVSLQKEQGNDGDLVVASTDRLGPDPKMVSKHVRVVDLRSPVAGNCDMYAGSAFSASPSPSSLPLPSFSKKKQLPIDDSATRDLRRLLRLDF